MKEEQKTALHLSDPFTTLKQDPVGLSDQQATYTDQLHAHIENRLSCTGVVPLVTWSHSRPDC